MYNTIYYNVDHPCRLVLCGRLVTALHVASEKGHGGIVELLVKHGAKVRVQKAYVRLKLYT